MKLLFAFIIVLLLLNSNEAQSLSNTFILTGKIEGKDSGYVYLNYISANGKGILDSCSINGKNFTFRGFISEPTKAFFSTFDFNGNFDENNFIEFYIEPTNMYLLVKINHFEQADIKGSISENEYKGLLIKTKSIRQNIHVSENKLNEYISQYNSLKDSKDMLGSGFLKRKQDSINVVIQEMNKALMIVDSTFIAQNPDSYVAADILSHEKNDWLSYSSFENLYERLSERIQKSSYGKKIKQQIEKEKVIAPGNIAKDFIAIDSKNDTISLRDYTGKKYVLLDFGASWCVPCRKIIPFLKLEYAKYDTALEIISIANEDNINEWQKAIEEDKAEWPQLFENNKTNRIKPYDKTITQLYLIDVIPSLVLLDKNSTIIGKYGGFYSSKQAYILDLKQKLNELFESKPE